MSAERPATGAKPSSDVKRRRRARRRGPWLGSASRGAPGSLPDLTDVVLIAVIGLRLLVPLGIPKYPLPLILAALVLDAADQTIFQAFHVESVLDEYQSYDKALDVYYLTLAYCATLRNWLDPFAQGVARFLFYYRLAGALAFELTGARAVLLVFPNTFEYVFIAYEAIRLGWNPSRMGHKLLLAITAAIWIVIKLPQELWLHVLELDSTEEAGAHPVLAVTLVVLAVLAVVGAYRVIAPRCPPHDRAPSFDVDLWIDRPPSAAVTPRRDMSAIFSAAVVEKVVLLATVAMIFSQVLSGVRATTAQVALGVTVLVVVNAAVSLYRVEHGSRYGSTLAQIVAMGVTNAAIVGVGSLARRLAGLDAYLPAQDAIFFGLLLSVVIAMYDRYRVVGRLSRDRRRRPRMLRRRPAEPAVA